MEDRLNLLRGEAGFGSGAGNAEVFEFEKERYFTRKKGIRINGIVGIDSGGRLTHMEAWEEGAVGEDAVVEARDFLADGGLVVEVGAGAQDEGARDRGVGKGDFAVVASKIGRLAGGAVDEEFSEVFGMGKIFC